MAHHASHDQQMRWWGAQRVPGGRHGERKAAPDGHWVLDERRAARMAERARRLGLGELYARRKEQGGVHSGPGEPHV